MARVIPNGECWCGCGAEPGLGSFFKMGHDKIAESIVIRLEYGSVPEFLDKNGYGPGQKNTVQEQERARQLKR